MGRDSIRIKCIEFHPWIMQSSKPVEFAVQNQSNRDKDLVPVHDESHEKPK